MTKENASTVETKKNKKIPWFQFRLIALGIILVLVVCWVIYYLSQLEETEFSKAATWSSIVGTIVSVILAVIAIYLTWRLAKTDETVSELKRQNEIITHNINDQKHTHLHNYRTVFFDLNQIMLELNELIETKPEDLEGFRTQAKQYSENIKNHIDKLSFNPIINSTTTYMTFFNIFNTDTRIFLSELNSKNKKMKSKFSMLYHTFKQLKKGSPFIEDAYRKTFFNLQK